jgi:hypothetical protein
MAAYAKPDMVSKAEIRPAIATMFAFANNNSQRISYNANTLVADGCSTFKFKGKGSVRA